MSGFSQKMNVKNLTKRSGHFDLTDSGSLPKTIVGLSHWQRNLQKSKKEKENDQNDLFDNVTRYWFPGANAHVTIRPSQRWTNR
jgi:hypothetical protein